MSLTCEQFRSRLTDSGILTAEELESFASGLPGASSPDDPRALAEALVEARRLTPFQAEVLLAENARPLRLGNYLLLESVGRGGMGHVHKAVHERMNRIVALKLLPPLAALDDGLVSRFRREVQVAAKLHHPHIVTAYDADEADGVHFLVMELVEGLDLGEVVAEEGPLPWRTALDYVAQAAEALEYAHGEGVLHRDVKPANLLVDDAGHVKILDMGLARLDASDGLTTTGEFLGTAATMAPEQGDDLRLVDERSDVYGLGCTLYYLLTGHHVYAGESVVQMLLAHASQPVPRLRDACPDAPEAVEQLFTSMVQKHREDRPATMGAVREAIRAIQAGDAPTLPPAPVARSGGRARRRGPALAALGLAVVLAALLGWALRSSPPREAAPPDDPGRLLQTLRGHDGAVHSVAWHPDERRLLSASSDGTIGVWDTATGELAHTLRGHTDSVRSVLCLSDGNTVLSSSDDATIRIWDLAERRVVRVLEGHEGKVRQLALAPDESYFVSAGKDGTLRVWNLPSGRERLVRSEHGPWVGDNRGLLGVAVRPDGKALATTAFDRTVRQWTVPAFEVAEILGPHETDVGSVTFSADGAYLLYDLDGGVVRVMDGDATREVGSLRGHEDWVYRIACTHRGDVAATGSQDRSIRLWRIETGECLATLDGHEYTVGALAFRPDDRVLASGAGDETVRLWDVASLTGGED